MVREQWRSSARWAYYCIHPIQNGDTTSFHFTHLAMMRRKTHVQPLWVSFWMITLPVLHGIFVLISVYRYEWQRATLTWARVLDSSAGRQDSQVWEGSRVHPALPLPCPLKASAQDEAAGLRHSAVFSDPQPLSDLTQTSVPRRLCPRPTYLHSTPRDGRPTREHLLGYVWVFCPQGNCPQAWGRGPRGSPEGGRALPDTNLDFKQNINVLGLSYTKHV